MKLIARIVILLLFLIPCINNAQAKPRARDFLKRGNIQFERNKIVKAIRHYTRAIELDPRLTEAYVRRGIARRAKGSLNGAIQDFEKAEAIDPTVTVNNRYVAGAYSNRGFIEMDDLQIEAVIADFTKAINSYRDATHYYRRGHARLIDEDVDGAIEDFSEALNANPENDFFIDDDTCESRLCVVT